jgi:hypothetical protein
MNRKQRRRTEALQRKANTEVRQRWENKVVEAFVDMGWTENKVRSHMRYIKSLPPNISTAVRSLPPSTYVETIVKELVEQKENSK